MDELEKSLETNEGALAEAFESDAVPEPSFLGEAEMIAKAVEIGLESGSYPEMNQQLAAIARGGCVKGVYVFKAPGSADDRGGAIICSLLSALFLYGLLIGAGTIVLSSNHFLIGLVFASMSFAGLFVALTLTRGFVAEMGRKARFDRYEEILGYRTLEFIEDLALCSKQEESVVIKDLKWAVKQNLIPQGHFSRDNLVFMVSDEMYGRYSEKPAVYDRYFQKKIEERRRIEARSERVSQIMEAGELYLEKVRSYATIIKEKPLAKKIGRMENVASMIFREIDANPSQAQSLGMFLNYYLPTSEKLLEAYVSLAEKQATGKSASKTKKEIEEAVSTIVVAFEGILEKLYQETEMDVASDIAAMELSMAQEGLPIQP